MSYLIRIMKYPNLNGALQRILRLEYKNHDIKEECRVASAAHDELLL